MAYACLAKISPLNATSGARVDIHVASANDSLITGQNFVVWEPAMIAQPQFGISLWPGDFREPPDPGVATLGLNMETVKKSYPTADSLIWAGAPIEIYAELPGAGWPWTARFKGKVSGFGRKDQTLTINAAVDPEPFEKNVLTAVYAGTGGAEGGADLKNRVKPLVLGWAQNVQPVLIDATNSIYQFSAYGAIEAVSVLYERGSDFGTALADHANYAALAAATIAPGRWATCLAEGMIRLGAPQAGVITGDIKGHKVGATTPRLTGAVISALATIAGVSGGGIEGATLTSLDAAVTGTIDIVLTEQIKWRAVANRLALDCNWIPGVSLVGKFFVSSVGFGGSEVFTLNAQGAALPQVLDSVEQDTSPPYFKTTMGFNRSWRVHSPDEIAAVAEQVDRGKWLVTGTYREGNLVEGDDGARWQYTNVAATSGNALPVWPTLSNAYWTNVTPPLWATPGAALGDSFVLNAGYWIDTSLWTLAGSAARVAGGGSDPASYVRCTSSSGYGEYNPVIRLQVGQGKLHYSYWRRGSVPTAQVELSWTFLTEAGTTISGVALNNFGTGGFPLGAGDVPSAAAASQWYLVVGVVDIPMNAAKVGGVRLTGVPASGQTVDMTGLMLATNEQSVGKNGKLAGIDVNATAADNMIQNAAMKDNSEGYTATNATRQAAASNDPSAYWRSTTGSQAIVLPNKSEVRPLNGAEKLFASMWVRSNVATSHAQLIVYFFKTGSLHATLDSGNFVATAANTWYFRQKAIAVPAGCDGYQAELHSYPLNGSAYVDMAAPRLAISEAHADITSLITGPAELIVNADYTGAIISALPLTASYRLIRSGVDVTDLCSWSVAVLSGTMSAGIGGGTGTLTIDVSGGVLTDGVIQITAAHNGINRSLQVPIFKVAAPTPVSATSGSATISGTLTSTTLADVTVDVAITLGAAGQAVLSAGTYDFNTAGAGSYGIYTHWHRWNGSAWVSVQTEVASEWNSGYVDLGEWGGSFYIPGSGKNSVTVTGLAANSAQQFRLKARLASGTTAQVINGSASAVGS